MIITLESGIMKDVFHQALREISAHNKSNLLEMIGVDPVVCRTKTDSSSVDLQIWITTITGSMLNQLVVPLYYTGARKYLFMCSSKNAVNFVMNLFQPRSLIADEVGLGKTIEAILLYQEYKLRNIVKRIIIIVPSGLVFQWHEELLSKFNEQFIIYSKDYIRTLKQSYGKETNVWTIHDKIILYIFF